MSLDWFSTGLEGVNKCLELSPSTVEKLLQKRLNFLLEPIRKNKIFQGFANRILESLELNDMAAEPYLIAQDKRLDEIQEAIKKLQLVSNSQLEMFLCVHVPLDSKLFVWQSIILAFALRHMSLFGTYDRTNTALRSFRLMCAEKDLGKRQKINQIFGAVSITYGIQDVIRNFRKLIKELPEEHSSIKNWVTPILLILNDISQRRLVNTRIRHAMIDEYGKSSSTSISVSQVKGDESVYSHTTFTSQSAELNSTTEQAEQRADNIEARQFYQVDTEFGGQAKAIRKSSYLSRYAAKTAVSQIERREKLLPTLYDSLTEYEVRVFLDYFGSLIKSPSYSTARIALMVYYLFLTGTPFEKLVRSRLIKETKKEYDKLLSDNGIILSSQIERYDCYLRVCKFDLPSHKLTPPFSNLSKQKGSSVYLPLPKYFNLLLGSETYPAIVMDLSKQSTDLEEISNHFSRINKQYGTRLTIRRVSSHLTYKLAKKGVDSVDISLITNNASYQPAGIYYQQYESISLIRTYYEHFLKEYLPYLGASNIFVSFLKTRLNEKTGRYGGSQLQIERVVLSELFMHVKSKFMKAKNLIDFHNYYTIYTLNLLNLATGHRPVREPFDDVSAFDLVSRKIFISDKEGRLGDASRVLVLPKTAVKQVEYYLTHLESIKNLVGNISEKSHNFIERSLSGEAPLLFLFAGTEDKITSITPKSYSAAINDFFNIPLNWHRHYLRTFLNKAKISSEAIDAWMGHARYGQEGFGRFSGFSMKGLHEIANTIDEHFDLLGVGSVEGWGRQHS